jgi:hypothetical protein
MISAAHHQRNHFAGAKCSAICLASARKRIVYATRRDDESIIVPVARGRHMGIRVIETQLQRACSSSSPRSFATRAGSSWRATTGASSRPAASRTSSSRTTTRARRTGCCAACTTRICAPLRPSWCAARWAAMWDVAVDLRVGSPTFGRVGGRRTLRRERAPVAGAGGLWAMASPCCPRLPKREFGFICAFCQSALRSLTPKHKSAEIFA